MAVGRGACRGWVGVEAVVRSGCRRCRACAGHLLILPTRVREIHGATCSAIADATALILALMIDPAAAAAAPPPEVKGSPAGASRSPAGASRSPPGASRSPPEPTGSPTPTSFRVTALAGLDTASLPGLAATLGLHGSFVHGAQRFEIGLAYHPSVKGTVAARPGTGGEVDLLAGSAATCRHFTAGLIEAGPCLGFEVGRLHASGFGVSDPGEGSTLWAAALAGGKGTIPCRPIARG